MPLKIIRQDITKIECDAVVNPTNTHLCPGGGVDLAIHEAAGEGLARACGKLGKLEIGSAVLTPAFALPCKYVIHTAGPTWYGGEHGERELLESCYRECLNIAKKKRCTSVAFPLISSGLYGYPKDKVLRIAVDVISGFLYENEMLVYLVVYDKSSYSISEKLFSDVTAFIDDTYVRPLGRFFERRMLDADSDDLMLCEESDEKGKYLVARSSPVGVYDLDSMLKNMDKGFAETLFEFIDEKGISDVECYKRANVDKKTFSKIKCNKSYKPSKVTAVSFAIALHLNMAETERLLRTVGMSLSRSNKFDVIIEYFITTGNYESIFDVNETLYQFDQLTLGV